MIPDDEDAEQLFEIRPDGSVGKKSLRLPTLNEVVCSECGAVKEDGSCPACTVTLVPHRTHDEWKAILAAVEAENDRLTATVARVKAQVVAAMASRHGSDDKYDVAKWAAYNSVRETLDSSVEPVRVKVGAQGYLFVQGNDGEPIGILYRPQSLGIAEQEDILFVPLKEKS